MDKLTLISCAKLNLFLHVTGRRRDGFHELYSLMVPISLSDQVEMEFAGDGIQVKCDHPNVPEDNNNLAYRAADLFAHAYRAKTGASPFKGVWIHIDKKIPVGGGLGGGSSNAASVLTGLNRVTGRLFSNEELQGMGRTLGADVPFFVFGKPAFATGVGEQLTSCSDLPGVWALICSPGVSASTVEVFKKLEFGLTFKPNYIMNTGSNELPFGHGLGGREKLQNDLEGPACSLYPEIGSTYI
jgi:4-diphosphocytidyl-2-C-methyl-D-erythritol kinase